jgi:hypothetical protein
VPTISFSASYELISTPLFFAISSKPSPNLFSPRPNLDRRQELTLCVQMGFADPMDIKRRVLGLAWRIIVGIVAKLASSVFPKNVARL